MKRDHEIAYRIDPALWMQEVLGITPRPWQKQFLRSPLGASILVLTARQVGKTTVAACAVAHTALFKPNSVSVVACPAQRQSAELLRKVREMVIKAGGNLIKNNVFELELANGARVLALPGGEDSIRGHTVDGWIVVDEAAFMTDGFIAALRPMRAQRPEARFVMLSTANTRTDPFWSPWETGGQSWTRIQVTVDKDPTLYPQGFLDEEREQIGEDAYKREFLGIPAGGPVSPFTWDYFDRASQSFGDSEIDEKIWNFFKPTIVAHDVAHAKDRSTAVVGGLSMLAPNSCLLKEFEELPLGLLGSDRADALAARIDRLYGCKSLIFADLSCDTSYGEILLERFGFERVIGIKITSSGAGMDLDYLRFSNGALRLIRVGRSDLLDTLLSHLHENRVRILDGQASRHAYEQLTMLEMEYKQSGTIYRCASHRHDDLAISMAIVVWAAQHPLLSELYRPLLQRQTRSREPEMPSGAWT